MAEEGKIVLVDQIEPLILEIRGQKVLLDSDLALLYGVPTKRLNEQVRRNRERFPEDFMLQLTNEEVESLRSQNATLKTGRGQHRKYLPYALTEHGVKMAAMLLNSPRAVEVSVFVVRGEGSGEKGNLRSGRVARSGNRPTTGATAAGRASLQTPAGAIMRI